MEEITQEIEIEDAEEKKDDAIEELLAKDVTPDLEIRAEVEKVEEEPEILEDHPGIALLDMAFGQSIEYCRKNNLPPPNIKVYQDFSRPFLNKAFWYYFPEGNLPDSPKVALLLGVAGLGMAYIPTIMAYYDRKRKEVEQSTEKKEAEEEQKAEEVKKEKEKTPKDIFREAWK